jgi:hypothetical protein
MAGIQAEACFAGSARGGFIEIFDWDRTDLEPARQTVTTGYADYVDAGARPLGELAANGLCFVEWDYTFAADVPGDVSLARWQGLHAPALPQPWHVTPRVSRRVTQDFDVKLIRGTVPASEGRVYIDEARGTVHGYVPFSYLTVIVYSNPIAVPIRELETWSFFNDNRFNCLGSFRSESLGARGGCGTSTVTDDQQWGCKAGAPCPPDPLIELIPGGGEIGPAYATGYHLIVDLERVWSHTLNTTLCASYLGVGQAEADGWTGSWGKNCRGSPLWNPDLDGDAGLPMGDWCSRTNGPADATCHDAFRYQSYSAGQAFKVQSVTTTAPGQSRWTGTCSVATSP